MQTIVYHSKARKTMCGMGTFCLIGMISFQLTMQNGDKFSFSKNVPLVSPYSIIDLGKNMGGTRFDVIAIPKYDGYFSLDAAAESPTQARLRAFKNGTQQTSGTLEVSFFICKQIQ